MKRVFVCIALLALMGLGGQAFASHVAMCAIQDAPAATLLLPYFEQDCTTSNGITTLFSVNNASAAATVAHVTVWSNKSIPVFDFDIYLTGYDVQTVNMRDVLCNGNLPVTGISIPGVTLSNVGAFSGPSTDLLDDFAGTCAAPGGNNAPLSPPNYQNPVITGNLRTHIQNWLSGEPSPFDGSCASAPTANLVGYLTIDDVHECNLEFPSSPGYFGPNGTGIASNHNTLWGDWFIVDTAENFAQGDTLVHVQAEDDFVGGPNAYTFYSRFVGITKADNREPLATNFGIRHFVGNFGGNPASPGDTSLLVWRDSTSDDVQSFNCVTGAPEWEPLCTRQLVLFDEEENPVTVSGPPISGIPEVESAEAFPEETQRVVVGGPDLPVPTGWEFGWIYLNLNHGTDPGCFTTPSDVALDPLSAQAWVSGIYSAFGKFSVGLDAVQLDTACDPFTGSIGTNPAVGPVE